MEGWGSSSGGGGPSTLSSPFVPLAIPAGVSRRLLMQLLCPFFSQGKMLPLSLLGSLMIELELDDADMCFASSGTNWSLVRHVIFCDTVQVDPQLSNSFAQHQGAPDQLRQHLLLRHHGRSKLSRLCTRLQRLL